LTGFHKRKLARKKKAREDFEKKLKEEKKKIKAEVNIFFSYITYIFTILFVNYPLGKRNFQKVD
jgi:hypothetical protein